MRLLCGHQRPGLDDGVFVLAVLFLAVYQTDTVCRWDAGRPLQNPVNFILTSSTTSGSIGGAEDGSDFARSLSVIRSRAIYVMIAVQSLDQLQNRYPNNLWAEIVGNLDIQLMLGCTDALTAEYFSARCGEMSVEVNSTMTVRRTIAVAQVIPQYRHTEGQGRRKLLSAG